MSIVSPEPSLSGLRTKMRGALYRRFELRNSLTAEMAAQATPLQWLEMAMDPNAFAGVTLNAQAEETFRLISLKHVAKAWAADPAQPGLGIAMARAMQRRTGSNSDLSGLAMDNFAIVLKDAELAPLDNAIAYEGAKGMAIAIMHRVIDAPPGLKANGQTLRVRLDKHMSLYAAPTLPLETATAPLRPSATNGAQHTSRATQPRLK